ncbi:pentatricopeptide repeat-containing protein At3g26782, mitochondrial-like [Hibiscus syriacus]|nr:pentatricopeptide repeat-containing protein At3g26782, mitochondrial-like [Hibiscus syriacus]
MRFKLKTPSKVEDTFISLIKKCNTLKSLKTLHASILRTVVHLDLHRFTTIISHYASLGSIPYAYTLFSHRDSSFFSDGFLWNVMLRGLVDNAYYHRSLLLYTRMQYIPIAPDNFTLPFLLKACASLRNLNLGSQLHAHAFIYGYSSQVFVANSLISMYARCGLFGFSKRVFDKMPQRSIVSWSAMIGAYLQCGFHDQGLFLFTRMLDLGIKPNRASILNAAACVRSEEVARRMHQVIVDNGFDKDHSGRNATMLMFGRCGRIDIAKTLFDGFAYKDLVCWASMIDAYSRADLPLEALHLFNEMRLQCIFPDSVVILAVSQACLILASSHRARALHVVIIRCLPESQLALDTAILYLYMKCGSLAYARKVFDIMKERNIISWSTMISGYGMHGYGREALRLFDQMKALMKPDHIAFVSILSACSHAGLITEGWECFNTMERDFGVKPKSEHYACMIDLLGRAGQLNQALEFIERMPVKPDAGVWGALLGACRIHSNIELAEVAAGSLLDLDAENPGRYVLLSNIYASLGKGTEAFRIRNLMKSRGVKKIVGQTSIDIKGNIYTFVSGDRSNPETDLIYSELGKLMERIRQEGYVPDLSFAFHDVEEETREMMLYAHSEKLAIVFGLIKSGYESSIRITKNLRVCGDCHTATKFISKVTGREIVVRDSQRFHHFVNGTCSCGDYW